MNPNRIIGLITDFGTHNRFTGIMKGVAYSIDPGLMIADISHQVESFNIMEAAYLLADTISYWPEGTVFCAVVDPGVGSKRKSLAVITRNNQYIICPDNGIISLVAEEIGLKELRQIDEISNRLPGTTGSATFDGRDIFIYNSAKLASGKIRFDNLGFLFKNEIIKINVPRAIISENGISGMITFVENPFGNLCTNIKADAIIQQHWKQGEVFTVTLIASGKQLFNEEVRFVKTFSEVGKNEPLLYLDSSGRLGMARNMAPINSDILLNPVKEKIFIEIKGRKRK